MTLNLKKKVTLTASQMLAENNRATADRLTWAAQTDEMNLRTALNVPENGLTEEMAEEARDRYGRNVLPTSQRTPLYKRLAAAFINPFTVVLVTFFFGLRPGVLFAHSGGLMFGDRFSGLDRMIDFVELLGVVLVSIEYRLAPEHRDPYPREDVYAALEWMASHAESLGVRLDRLLIAGASAGGGLAAGVALAARDRGGPRLCGQLLDYPMLDDRGLTKSTRQFDGIGVWDRVSNVTGWSALLGDARGGPDVSVYAAPARATQLHDLPPAFLDVGSAEIFRDETVAYADALWNAGGDAELHVWPGGFHAFDIFAPHTALSRGMIATRSAWMSRVLGD